MTTTTTITLPERIRRMDGDRLRRYADHLAFYNGEQWPAMVRDRRRRLVFNYAKAIIDKTASYLLTGMHVAADPEDGTPEAAARARETEVALAEIAAANNLEQLDFDTEVDAAVLGDGAYKVTWDAAERRVRISAPDVQGLFAWHDGDDITRVRRVASRYSIDAETAREVYGVQPRAARVARPSPAANGSDPSVEVVESWTDAEFELWVDGRQVERQENPYGFIPFVIFPNLREPKKFWGVSDLPAIKEPLRELNRAFTQLSMILELSGNPIAVLENVTESSDIAVVPGAVWELPEHARAYLLDLLQGGGVKLHADYIEMLYRALHDLGESPRTAFGDNRAALSGVALNIELDPLLKKVSRKRLIRAAAYRRRNEMALRILERFGDGAGGGAGGGRSFAPYRTRIVWGSVLPLDRSRLVEDERALVAAGIHSRRRAADELGVEDPETEFRRWLEERRMEGEVAEGGGEGGRAGAGPSDNR